MHSEAVRKTHVTKIIENFSKHFCPQTLVVAENIFSRFLAGDSIPELQLDYCLSLRAVEAAVRFFALHRGGNARVRAVYYDWQTRRWQSAKV